MTLCYFCYIFFLKIYIAFSFILLESVHHASGSQAQTCSCLVFPHQEFSILQTQHSHFGI